MNSLGIVAETNEEKMIDIGKYLHLIKRNLIRISLLTLLVSLITTLVVFSITPKYTATATLLIEPEIKNAVSIEEVVGIDSNKKGFYQTQIEILKSRKVSERVINQLNIAEYPEFNYSLVKEKSFISTIKTDVKSIISSLIESEKTQHATSTKEEQIRQSILRTFQSNIYVSEVEGTQLVNISFTSENPELAAQVANAIGEAYIAENMDAKFSASQQATTWISGRLSELKNELKKSESALTAFLREEKLIDDSGIDTQASTLISELTIRLNEIRDRRIELESSYLTLQQGSDKLSTIPEISRHPQVVALRNVLAETEKEVNELAKRYGPRHEKMKAALAKRDSANNELTQLIKQLVSGVKKELSTVKNQEKLISKELQERIDEFQSLSVKKREYQALSREVQTNRNILNVFLNRYKETEATQDYKSEFARFTDKAMIPQTPAKPNKKVIIVGSAFITIFLCIAAIILLDILKNTVSSIKQFEERMGIVPLGGIPNCNIKNKKDLTNDIFFDERAYSFSESIRAIRTSLALSSMKNGRKCLAITSSLPNEGKTTTAINIAQAFAQMENVLLIDADLRRPSISERFGKKKYHQGITNYLLMGTELDDCIIHDKTSNLSILPAGMLTVKPQELLDSKGFTELLELLKEKYDRIIIDTPPTLVVNDSLIISKLVGSVAMVVKADSTRYSTLKNAIARFSEYDVIIDGVIINKIKREEMMSDYSYGSYYSEANEEIKIS
ncbi:GumC family protein [Vibrio sp. NTOU-M3]|uniref:GumC family protein n=1 Tax=Vibrio sp. NTOU-M3 TaxID=3234954 RepID=UPI00349F0CDB